MKLLKKLKVKVKNNIINQKFNEKNLNKLFIKIRKIKKTNFLNIFFKIYDLYISYIIFLISFFNIVIIDIIANYYNKFIILAAQLIYNLK